jgi:hypothetical protein
MYRLGERPLTWLFWIATVCADGLGTLKHPDADWFGLLMIAQVYVVCGWAAVSHGHRLARAGIALAATLVVSLLRYYSQRSAGEAQVFLAACLTLGALVVIFTGGLSFILRALPGQRRGGERNKFQLSTIELFGWTIVTAMGSWALTLAELPSLDAWGLWSTLLSPVPAAIMVAGFLGPRRFDRAMLVVCIAAVAFFLFAAYRWDNHQTNDLMNWAQVFAYVAFWIFVVRLDDAAAPEPSLAD